MTNETDISTENEGKSEPKGQYAIFQTGGKQYQAVPGKTLAVEKIEGEADAPIEFSEVLFLKKGEDQFEFGRPHVKNFTLKAKIVKQIRGPKLIIFKMKRRKKSRVKKGHRQPYTVIRFEDF